MNAIQEYKRRWTQNNPDKVKKARDRWAKDNPDKVKKARECYARNNPDKLKESRERWLKENPQKRKESMRKYRETHRDAITKYNKQCQQKRRLTSSGKINHRMEVSIRKAIDEDKNGHTWESLVGYTTKDLKRHLENLFTDGMTWDNIVDWHIDHIIPQSFFKFTSSDDVEFRMCWRLENLQPLWAMDNFIKNDTMGTKQTI